ncbi:type II secretion system GspH family protein [Caldibacillus lycopersici]|uniref:Type II secretion system GspH family protein n=1 Tax=Perspicuibacillus lycopersici TaxID=1325689 RepID=A0AAE3IXW2_9BACI|nr:type II secretion system protein [Perspicuibacillus lycopersici]MCU9614025.1 type II secretion system GspH family protein [Perspicuibacillus lycopersici]
MTRKKMLNQQGVTLLEILVSIVILSIILVSMMYIFPQMGFINQKNQEKTQAINTAKEILVEWQRKEEIISFLAKPTLHKKPDYLSERTNDYYAAFPKGDWQVAITIAKQSDINTNPTKAHQIHVQLYGGNHSVVSESYGYILVEE